MDNEMLGMVLANNDTEFASENAAGVADLAKALLAPESVNDMYEAPGGVLTKQSLEGMLVDLTLNEKDYTFWQDVNKIKAYSTVEEFDQQIGLGISDGGFVGQMENPDFRDPDFQKDISVVRYMSEGWTVGDVAMSTNNIIDKRTQSQRSAMGRLLRNLDKAFYSANSAWIPKQFNGLATTIANSSSEQVRDLRGENLTMNTFNLIGQLITEANGEADNANIYTSPAGVQNLSKILETGATATGDRKIVEMGSDGIKIGGRIKSIMTAYGEMTPRMDKILGLEYEAKQVPYYYDEGTRTWKEGATSDNAPSVPSFELTVNAATTDSKFSTGTVRPSGEAYQYRVLARNNYGRSIAAAAQVAGSAVGAGGSISITITPSQADAGKKLPSCFEIYSEQVAGSGVFRYLYTVAVGESPLSQVTYVDKNDYIPGTARMYVVDQTSQGEQRVMSFSQLLPIHNTPLAKTFRGDQGLINLYGVPKYYKPNVLVEIRNIGVEQTVSNLFNTV